MEMLMESWPRRHLGVPEVWIVDLQNRRVLFYRVPAGGEYGSRTSAEPPAATQVISSLDVTVDLSGLLAP
jgi:Uma2 family endonuclease